MERAIAKGNAVQFNERVHLPSPVKKPGKGDRSALPRKLLSPSSLFSVRNVAGLHPVHQRGVTAKVLKFSTFMPSKLSMSDYPFV